MSFAAGAFSSGARGGGHSSGNDSNRRQFGVGGNKGGVQSCQGKDGEYDQTLGPGRIEERCLHLECWAGRAGGRHHAPTLIPLSLPRPG